MASPYAGRRCWREQVQCQRSGSDASVQVRVLPALRIGRGHHRVRRWLAASDQAQPDRGWRTSFGSIAEGELSARLPSLSRERRQALANELPTEATDSSPACRSPAAALHGQCHFSARASLRRAAVAGTNTAQSSGGGFLRHGSSAPSHSREDAGTSANPSATYLAFAPMSEMASPSL